MKEIVDRAVKHWRTTLVGVVLIVGVALQVYTDPASLATAEGRAALIKELFVLLGGAALLGAKDE